MKFPTVVIYFVGIAISSAFALQCYQCTAQLNTNHTCEVNLTQDLSSECTAGFECVQSIVTTGNTSVISRFCGPATSCNVINANTTEINKFAESLLQTTVDVCIACSTDLCNSSNFVGVDILVFILSIVFGFLILC